MKANTLCRNAFCNKGDDGGRKLYYSCAYCTKIQNRRSVCCSQECYDAYAEQVYESRSKNKQINLFPERIDMSEQKIQELLNKPIEEVIEETKIELSDYSEDLETLGFAGTVDKINKELDETVDVENELEAE